jgi:hypothetical protein
MRFGILTLLRSGSAFGSIPNQSQIEDSGFALTGIPEPGKNAGPPNENLGLRRKKVREA